MASRRKVVFVVDDDAGFRKSMAVLLDKFGFQTELYASAEEFLTIAKSAPPGSSCIVVDIQLEGICGIELARRLARDGPAPAVIFITGNDCAASRQAATEQGCVAYLTKPFGVEPLMDAINRALA